MSGADQPRAGQRQPSERKKREWSTAKTTIVAGVFVVVAAVISPVIATLLSSHQESGSSSTPTATSTHSSPSVRQSAASPGMPIPVSPAFPLYDPDSTGVYGVAFSRSGTLAAGDLNGSGYLWDVAKDKVNGHLSRFQR